MRMPRLLTGLIVACGLAGTAQATELMASDPVYGGPSQNRVVCTVYNASNNLLLFSEQKIVNQAGQATWLWYDDCQGALGPHDMCTFQGPAGDQAYACHVRLADVGTTPASARDVRGTLAAFNNSLVLLSEAPLRSGVCH